MKAGVAILTFCKVDLKPKLVRTHKESHYMLIKGMTQQEDIPIINKYTLNVSKLNSSHKKLLDIIARH